MGATGTTTLNFGALPGKADASVAVTGQASIVADSLVEAWILPADTADHKADEHIVEGMKLFAGSIVAGTGFTIYAVHDHGVSYPTDQAGTEPAKRHFCWGRWNVAWAWN